MIQIKSGVVRDSLKQATANTPVMLFSKFQLAMSYFLLSCSVLVPILAQAVFLN
jgi:hypothetical protein